LKLERLIWKKDAECDQCFELGEGEPNKKKMDTYLFGLMRARSRFHDSLKDTRGMSLVGTIGHVGIKPDITLESANKELALLHTITFNSKTKEAQMCPQTSLK